MFSYYLKHADKAKHTMDNETSFLNSREGFSGTDMRLDKISEASIREFLRQERQRISDRTGKPLSNHSINVRVYALRSMLRMAKDERRIGRLPFDGIKKLTHHPDKKKVPSVEQIEESVSTAIAECPKSGRQFADYLHLLMYTGARETEASSLQWEDIDFDRRQVHFHRNTKFGKERWLGFNPKLEAHFGFGGSEIPPPQWLQRRKQFRRGSLHFMLRPAPLLERLTSPCRQLAPPTCPPVYSRARPTRDLPPTKVCYDYLAQPSIAEAGLAPASISKTEGCA